MKVLIIFFLDQTKKFQNIYVVDFFLERGNPKVHWDAGINALPVKIAIEKKIKLIFYAEHGESEYGGKIIDKDSSKIRNLEEVLENQIGDDPTNWIDENVTLNDLIRTDILMKKFNFRK
jgi:hypothetical protein